jgi:signal transduction histidine kinase
MAEDPKNFVLDATLVSNFTHQVINPLNGVVGTLDNLIDGTITGARRDQRLKAVRAQLVHSIELVRNLAYLSTLSTDAGRESLRSTGASCLLPEIIIEAAMIFQEAAQERAMKIRLDDRRTSFVVTGHADLLRQVFTNLFENAVKYGREDTIVHVRIHGQRTSGELIVEVANDGPGFKYDDREKLFERGFRGQEARERIASGSGLGLYICREILDAAFGARIEAEHSQKNSETVFRIRFPQFRIDEAIRRDRVKR